MTTPPLREGGYPQEWGGGHQEACMMIPLPRGRGLENDNSPSLGYTPPLPWQVMMIGGGRGDMMIPPPRGESFASKLSHSTRYRDFVSILMFSYRAS